jgi:hypothetical protein
MAILKPKNHQNFDYFVFVSKSHTPYRLELHEKSGAENPMLGLL